LERKRKPGEEILEASTSSAKADAAPSSISASVSLATSESNDLQTKKVEHLLLDMVKVSSGTATRLYDCLNQMLQNKNIRIENMVGFSSDTTNVMVGKDCSVFALLKKDLPHIALGSFIFYYIAVNPSEAKQFKIKSVVPVLKRFLVLNKFVTAQKLDDEWRVHAVLDFVQHGLELHRDNIDEECYWGKVFRLKNGAGQYLFPNIKIVMFLLLMSANDPYKREAIRLNQMFDEVSTDEEKDPYNDSDDEYGSERNYVPSSSSDTAASSSKLPEEPEEGLQSSHSSEEREEGGGRSKRFAEDIDADYDETDKENYEPDDTENEISDEELITSEDDTVIERKDN
ncbi:hypothetical protein ILUMI_06157, partial [Ignelater luminosus]